MIKESLNSGEIYTRASRKDIGLIVSPLDRMKEGSEIDKDR